MTIDRINETRKFKTGDRVTCSGFKGIVYRLYIDGDREGARMYEVRVPGGMTCVCGSDLFPRD